MRELGLFTILAVLGTAAVDAASVRGVDPAVAAKYTPSSSNTFTCLSDGKVIAFSAVNDNFCDCADGSDEPGTSACEGRELAYFYCENKGHIPAKILSSRVGDGICDPECCDGSDEWQSGLCPNTCEEISREYRNRIEKETKTRRTGAKVRSTYVNYAQKEMKRLEEELAAKRQEVAIKERKVEEALTALERAEAQSKEELERKKRAPVFQSLEGHRRALVDTQKALDRASADVTTLLKILEELSKGYNPNYQDMAVKAAVMGYKELVGQVDEGVEGAEPQHKEGEASDNADAENAEAAPPPEPLLNTLKPQPEGEMSSSEITQLKNQDLEGLLVIGDGDNDDDDDVGLLYRIEEYIPDSLFEYYDNARVAVLGWLTTIGVIKPKQHSVVAEGAHVVAARENFNKADRELTNLQNDINSAQRTFDRLSNGVDFGPQGEWKKLDGTCINMVSGDYTYELCFFGSVTQRSNKDSSSNNIGSFSSWNTTAEPGSFDYYTKQAYTNGMRCWNGPMRSANVELSCGTSNELYHVSEPEKCEYKLKAYTPALCWPLEGETPGKRAAAAAEAEAGRDEL